MKNQSTNESETSAAVAGAAHGSAFRRNAISGERYPLPRIMWADCDEEDKRTPVVIYDTKADQRGNRPELKAVPVVVIPLGDADTMHTHLLNAIQAAKERGIKTPNEKCQR